MNKKRIKNGIISLLVLSVLSSCSNTQFKGGQESDNNSLQSTSLKQFLNLPANRQAEIIDQIGRLCDVPMLLPIDASARESSTQPELCIPICRVVAAEGSAEGNTEASEGDFPGFSDSRAHVRVSNLNEYVINEDQDKLPDYIGECTSPPVPCGLAANSFSDQKFDCPTTMPPEFVPGTPIETQPFPVY